MLSTVGSDFEEGMKVIEDMFSFMYIGVIHHTLA